MASPTNPALLPDAKCLHLICLQASPQLITAVVATAPPQAQCPVCQYSSEKVHSRYTHLGADLPWMGWAVRLELHTRRFFCQNHECPRQIFTERLPTVVAPYARRTMRLTDVFTLVSFALGGEAGRRLVAGMGLSSSSDTLLRLIQRAPETAHATPRILGVDDWSFRRGRKFGTILIDLEKRLPIELLPDREASTLAKWLQEHPGLPIYLGWLPKLIKVSHSSYPVFSLYHSCNTTPLTHLAHNISQCFSHAGDNTPYHCQAEHPIIWANPRQPLFSFPHSDTHDPLHDTLAPFWLRRGSLLDQEYTD
ncbi:transposase family protein [Ktedonospora formicarum]|uniref:transposase family protein n=1 Tax=Ktedonospora formicarum TaxID=2778364 RepID=UPI001C6912D6|nr:transposase family protein [Ktedonospora formicarum]